MKKRPCNCHRYTFPHRPQPACEQYKRDAHGPGWDWWQDQRDRTADLKDELARRRD